MRSCEIVRDRARSCWIVLDRAVDRAGSCWIVLDRARAAVTVARRAAAVCVSRGRRISPASHRHLLKHSSLTSQEPGEAFFIAGAGHERFGHSAHNRRRVCILCMLYVYHPQRAAANLFWLSEVQTTSQIRQIVRDRTRSYEIVWIVWVVLDRAPIHRKILVRPGMPLIVG